MAGNCWNQQFPWFLLLGEEWNKNEDKGSAATFNNWATQIE